MGAGLLAACGAPSVPGVHSQEAEALAPSALGSQLVLLSSPGHSGTGRGMMISLLCVRLPAGEPSDHAGPGT